MSPRTYAMERRQAAADQTRARILGAARNLLIAPDFREFTMEAVAKAADVSRLTVYYQFESKAGLLEALYDYIAKKAHLGPSIADVFRYGNVTLNQLRKFIEVFVYFWASDRDVIRRLHGLGAIDAEIGQSLRARNERRRKGLTVLVEQLCRDDYRYVRLPMPLTLDLYHMLTSFETYDALAINGRRAEDVIKIIRRMAEQAIGMWPPPVSIYQRPPAPITPEQRQPRTGRRKKRR